MPWRPPEYEHAAPVEFVFCGEPGLLRAVLPLEPATLGELAETLYGVGEGEAR